MRFDHDNLRLAIWPKSGEPAEAKQMADEYANFLGVSVLYVHPNPGNHFEVGLVPASNTDLREKAQNKVNSDKRVRMYSWNSEVIF